jgi:hypothetical protein
MAKVNVEKKNDLDDGDDLFNSTTKINFKKPPLAETKPSFFDDPFVTKNESSDKKVEIKSSETPKSSLSTQESELFEGIQTDRSFSEQSFKNVQKVFNLKVVEIFKNKFQHFIL